MSPVQIVCAVLVPLLWGYQYVVIKAGLAEFPPLFFLGLRFLAIAPLLIPFVKRPARRDLVPIVAISVFIGGLNFGLFYIGLGRGPGTMAAVAYQLATPFAILLAWPMLGEPPSLRTSAGVLLAFVGVLGLFAGPGQSVNAIPVLLVVGSAFAFAVGNVLTKRYGPFDPVMLMGWSSLFTVPQVMLASLMLEHGQLASVVAADAHGWLALAYTVVFGGIIGFGLWFWLIGRCPMSRIAPFGLLLPVFALISSVLFLGEPLTATLIAGALICIAGVAITQSGSSKASAPNTGAVGALHNVHEASAQTLPCARDRSPKLCDLFVS
jgi:O-acetylserine/cysteine efflux transporter